MPTPTYPPETLAAAEKRFKDFLSKNGYPQDICWVTPKDVVFWAHECFVRRPKDNGFQQAELRYAARVSKGLGVELRAICANKTETVATVYVPTDETDAQYHLMSFGLKCSCPNPGEFRTLRIAKNRLKWFMLSRRDRGRNRWLLE